MKKIIVSLISVCLMFLGSTFIVACNNGEINTPNIITNLYVDGILSQADIKNIAAIRVGYVALVDSEDQKVEDYRHLDYDAKEPTPLSDEQKNKIEIDFMNDYGSDIYNFKIVDYYGVYSNRYIMEVSYLVDGADYTQSVEKIIVGNIYLGYIGLPNRIYVWQDR